jgi:TRAP-type C4-dicarboxylate transport system substrate-binding protein
VRTGRAQLGWVGARAWTGVGVHTFDALNMPFEVHSYAGEQAELGPADRARLAAGVSAAGVDPVSVVPGPLRFLLLRRPVRSPADLHGLRIGVFASVVGERALRALGAIPVPLARGAALGDLDGVAAGLGDLAVRYVQQAPYLLADAPLVPAPRVIFANRRTWSALSAQDRAILRHAGDEAFAGVLRAWEAADRDARPQLCDAGVRLLDDGPAFRAALRRRVAPVYDRLRRLPAARAGLQAVTRARASDRPAAPLACGPRASREAALTGVFTYVLHRGDPGHPADFEGFRWVRAEIALRDGRAVQTIVYPDGHAEPEFDEAYSVYRDRITLGELTARWQLNGNRLRFTEMNGGRLDHWAWETHPWIRVGR